MATQLQTRPADALTLLRERRWHALRRVLATPHPADVADLLATLGPDEQAVVFRLLGRRRGQVFAYLAPEHRQRVIHRADPAALAAMVGQMSSDDRARVLGTLPKEVAQSLLAQLPQSAETAS